MTRSTVGPTVCRWTTLAWLLAGWSMPAVAEPAPARLNGDLREALAHCAGVGDAGARLVCYDELARRASGPMQTTSDGALTAPAPVPDEAPAAARDAETMASSAPAAAAEDADFGAERLPDAREQRRDTQSLRSTLAGLSRGPRGEAVFELDNGQVWIEVTPERHPYQEGIAVTIRRGAFGSYMLSTDRGGATRVRRVR